LKREIELLVELQGFDSAIIRADAEINSIPERLAPLQSALAGALAGLSEARQRLESARKKRKDREKDLEDVNEKTAKLKARISEIKTNIEYQARLKEMEAKDKERLKTEDEILTLMEEVEALEASVKSAEKTMAEEQGKLDALKKTLDEDAAHATAELGELRKKRTAVAGQLPPDIYNFYMRLLESLKGLAVVEAKDEVCLGCNMNIMPQLFVEIRKNEEIIQCPQCNRILYYIPAHEKSPAL